MNDELTMHHVPNLGLLLCAILSLSYCDSSVKEDIRNLGHKRAGVRLHAIESLSRNRDPRSIEALNNALNDPATRVRLKAIDVLAAIGDPSSVEPILTKIDDPERIVGLTAIEALGELRDTRAVESLSNLITRPDPNVRVTAITALGEIGSNKCTEIILGCLKDSDKYIRSAAILALSNIGDPRAINPLTEALSREVENDTLSSLIVYALEKLDPDWVERESTDRAISNMISDFKDKKLTETKRRGIAATFGRINRHWKDEDWARKLKGEFLDRLNDKNPLVRESAAEGLGEFGDKSLFSHLYRALVNEPDWNVRCDLSHALGEIGDARAVKLLCRMLDDSIPRVRFSAAVALGKIGDTTAVIALTTALTDVKVPDGGPSVDIVIENPLDVFIAIARALGEIQDTRSADALKELLGSRSDLVRRAATAALGKIGDRGAVNTLVAALNDPSLDVRREAATALSKIGDKRAVQAMLEAVKSKRLHVRDVSRSLDMLDRDWRRIESTRLLVGEILRDFRHLDLETRMRAAEDLGEIADNRSTDVLMQELRNRNLPVVAGAHRFFLGQETTGYESVLIDALTFYGDTNMAERFLKSRNARLVRAARDWARRRNLTLFSWPIKENLIQ